MRVTRSRLYPVAVKLEERRGEERRGEAEEEKQSSLRLQ
jgi:uncharacterized protein (DUF169 family)